MTKERIEEIIKLLNERERRYEHARDIPLEVAAAECLDEIEKLQKALRSAYEATGEIYAAATDARKYADNVRDEIAEALK